MPVKMPNPSNNSPKLSAELLTFALRVEQAAYIVTSYFGKSLELEEKSSAADFRTKADLDTEAAITEAIEVLFPDWSYHGEERGFTDKRSDYKFVIDPLDGTNNFSLGIPVFTTSVALLNQGEMEWGIIVNPVTTKTYIAEKGKGAWLGDQRLQVSTTEQWERSTINYTCGYETADEIKAKRGRDLQLSGVKRTLSFWSPANAYTLLAAGKIEAIINEDNDPYDFLAGKLIALEAGAKLSKFDGSAEQTGDCANTKFVMSNGQETIHQKVLEFVR